jgi:hypothetical protein
VVPAGESSGGVGAQVQHQPRVLSRRAQLVVERPPAAAHLLLPRHRVVGHVVAAAAHEIHRVQLVGAEHPAAQPLAGAIDRRVVVEHQRLVHAPGAAGAREPRRLRERARRPAVLRADAGRGVEVAVLQHHHPELPRRRVVGDLAQVAQVQLLRRRVEVHVGDRCVRRGSGERVARAEVVVEVGHPVRHLVRRLAVLVHARLCKRFIHLSFLSNRIFGQFVNLM